MKSGDYRRWATEHGVGHGSGTFVGCQTIAEAEAYIRDYPRDARGFATSGEVEIAYTTEDDTRARLRTTLSDAGYTRSEDGPSWSRDGFSAQATISRRNRSASIFVRDADAAVAYATGPDSYTHPSDRPEV
jgi:hypothetical protein